MSPLFTTVSLSHDNSNAKESRHSINWKYYTAVLPYPRVINLPFAHELFKYQPLFISQYLKMQPSKRKLTCYEDT